MAIHPFAGHTPELAQSCFIAATASVIGHVRVDDDATVMFGAVLRGDRETITLGAGSNLQDNAVVHADPGFPAEIGRGVSIGHGAIVHGARIDDHVIIGMGACVLNGAVVGSDSIIAAGAIVKEGAHIPPGSLVAGVPGAIRRETTAKERAHIRTNAEVYRELGRAYRESDS